MVFFVVRFNEAKQMHLMVPGEFFEEVVDMEPHPLMKGPGKTVREKQDFHDDFIVE